MLSDDKKVLLACIGGSIVSYNAFRALKSIYNSCGQSEWVPVGMVKHLRVYPVKSCRGQEVFSLHCDARGVSFGDLHDREFLVIDGKTGLFLTARAFPKMILMECNAVDGVLTIDTPDGKSVRVVLSEVIAKGEVKRGTLFDKLQADGLDCGDEIGRFFDEWLDTTDTRVIFYRPNLFNGRPCIPQKEWWNNPVPKRNDTIMYADLAPYLITSEGSVRDLNTRLENKVTSLNFRGNIVVEHSAAWDEDKWADVRIGDAQLQCFSPSTRCILTTVNPQTGEKDKDMQPLKELRQFRLAPEGQMRKAHGQSPCFGVNCGLVKPGYIHVGQTVYVKYKPSAF
ncbi:hypothetical protein PFISCL1PPCAC_14374 [Pristionchus fissidentatus]|uniref:MOSC domain-containing protein n=1 Tax=Pristionchus fissidentatus TaxID=1538716 RepID=A0AAV5VTR3_9BILA|nr:hypothetical protein PFISCL1PPCAC_14374 [Pristionchus fissidentatus]